MRDVNEVRYFSGEAWPRSPSAMKDARSNRVTTPATSSAHEKHNINIYDTCRLTDHFDSLQQEQTVRMALTGSPMKRINSCPSHIWLTPAVSSNFHILHIT